MPVSEQPDRSAQPMDDASAVRLAVLEQLRALAERAARYLRRSAMPAVRLSAALLLAASLAACDRSEEVAEEVPAAVEVQALTEEIAAGLPLQPGRYPVQPESVYRDQRGVYQFAWLDQRADGTQQAPHGAYVSRLQLAQAEKTELEVAAAGDPTLYLPPNTPIRLVEASAAGAAPTPTERSSVYVAPSYPLWALWHPFPAWGAGYSRPTYYDPPSRPIQVGERVEGGVASTTPKPLGDRVGGLSTAVSGRAGGTGSGSAVTNKSGAGGKSGAVTAPKSSGFSSGRGSVGTSSSS